MLNQRLEQVEAKFSAQMKYNADRFNYLNRKLDQYQKLPINLKFMATLPLLDIFKAITCLIEDPFELMKLVE